MTSFFGSNIVNVWFRYYYGKDILVFDTDMTLQHFNCFRRIILSKIIMMAVDVIQMIENDSSMVDEVLSNRIGLIPVSISNEDSFIRKDLCECHTFCDKCSFTIEYKSKKITEKSWLFSNEISPFLMKKYPYRYDVSRTKNFIQTFLLQE